MNQAKDKIWTPVFTAITAINFLHSLGFYLLLVMLTQYSVLAFGVSYGVAGLGMTVYVVSSVLTRMFLGSRIDVWGPKVALIVGFAFNIAACLIYLPQISFELLLVGRFIHGVGNGLCSGAAAAAAAIVLPSSRKAEGMGYYNVATPLAGGIGPTIAIMFINYFESYFAMFLLLLVVNILGTAFCLLIPMRRVRVQGRHVEDDRALLSRIVYLKALPLTAIVMLAFFCYSGVVSFLTLFADTRDLQFGAGLYFIVYAVVGLVTRPWLGRVVDRKGENRVLYATIPVIAFAFVMLALSHSDAILLLSALFMGIGVGGTQSVLMGVVTKLAPAGQQGLAQSTFINGMDIGLGIGPVLLGVVVGQYGYVSTFCIIALIALAIEPIYYAIHGRKASEAKRES